MGAVSPQRFGWEPASLGWESLESVGWEVVRWVEPVAWEPCGEAKLTSELELCQVLQRRRFPTAQDLY